MYSLVLMRMIIDTDDNIPWVELGKKNWCIDDDDDD